MASNSRLVFAYDDFIDIPEEMFFGESWVNRCLAGEISMTQIGEYIEYWHGNATGKTLPEFLGMTDQEYGRWLATGEDSTLREILDAHSAANGCVLQTERTEPVQEAAPEPDWEPEI